MLKHPSLSILFKCKIEKIPAHNGLSQDIQASGWLRVSVGVKLHGKLAIGHNGCDV